MWFQNALAEVPNSNRNVLCLLGGSAAASAAVAAAAAAALLLLSLRSMASLFRLSASSLLKADATLDSVWCLSFTLLLATGINILPFSPIIIGEKLIEKRSVGKF